MQTLPSDKIEVMGIPSGVHVALPGMQNPLLWEIYPSATTTIELSYWTEEGSASIIQTLNQEIQQLERIYLFRKSREVKEYLQTNSFLAPFLFEAFEVVQRFFGMNPSVVLEVTHDPEAPDESELFAYIQTTLSPPEPLERLRMLDEEWFLDQLAKLEGKFNFNIEYV